MTNRLSLLLVGSVVFLVSVITTIAVFLILSNQIKPSSQTTTNNDDSTIVEESSVPIKTMEYNDQYFSSCSNNAISDAQVFDFLDTFDTAVLDTNNWFSSATGNIIAGGKLNQSSVAPLESAWITHKKYLKGDFSTEIVLDSFDGISGVKDKDSIIFLKAITKDQDFFNALIVKNYRGISVTIGGMNGAQKQMPYFSTEPIYLETISDLKRVKLTRVGTSNAHLYLDFGQGYELVASKDGVTDAPVSIGFGNQNFSPDNQIIKSSIDSISALGCEDLG